MKNTFWRSSLIDITSLSLTDLPLLPPHLGSGEEGEEELLLVLALPDELGQSVSVKARCAHVHIPSSLQSCVVLSPPVTWDHCYWRQCNVVAAFMHLQGEVHSNE